MSDKQETIADIIAEMRGFKRYAASDSGDCRYVAYWLYQTFADRLEAAHRRESAFHAMVCEANDRLREHLQIALDADSRESATAEKSSAVGDAAKLREVVELLARVALPPQEDYPAWYGGGKVPDEDGWLAWIRQAQSYAKSALAAPPRNCDIHTDFNDAIKTLANKRNWHDGKWDSERYCIFASWLFAPATEKEGGAK